MTPAIKIYEVGPRDGLQNEKKAVPAVVKIELIDRLADAGLKYIEAGAFVSPKWVPQMADTAEVFAGIHKKPEVTYAALVPNEKGLEAAIASKVTEIAVFTAASETFCQRNINCSIDESLTRFMPVIDGAKAANIRVRGYVSCIAGCPYEGEIDPTAVAAVAGKLHAMGCYEISLGDTIGVGTPDKIRAVLKTVSTAVPMEALALHCHDTYGRALDNIQAGMEEGIRVFDSSVAGLGGCPYAPGASGNVATERVLALMADKGLETGINPQLIAQVGAWIREQIDGDSN